MSVILLRFLQIASPLFSTATPRCVFFGSPANTHLVVIYTQITHTLLRLTKSTSSYFTIFYNSLIFSAVIVDIVDIASINKQPQSLVTNIHLHFGSVYDFDEITHEGSTIPYYGSITVLFIYGFIYLFVFYLFYFISFLFYFLLPFFLFIFLFFLPLVPPPGLT